jgi:hypothetical protein
MRMSRTTRLALAFSPALLLAACQAEEEAVAPEPAATDVSGGELIAVPADSASPQGVTVPETPMTPVAPSAAAAPADSASQ